MGSQVTYATIAGWIKQTILHVYRQASGCIPVPSIRANSLCMVVSSWTDIKGASLSDLCAAAIQSSSLVLAKHYRLDITATGSVSMQLLSAAVASSYSIRH